MQDPIRRIQPTASSRPLAKERRAFPLTQAAKYAKKCRCYSGGSPSTASRKRQAKARVWGCPFNELAHGIARSFYGERRPLGALCAFARGTVSIFMLFMVMLVLSLRLALRLCARGNATRCLEKGGRCLYALLLQRASSWHSSPLLW